MNATLYHGTTADRWSKPDEDGAPLYLVNSFEEAGNYASEAGEADWDDDLHEEGGNTPNVIVLAFRMSDIQSLAAAGAVQLEPDWGWVQGEEHEAKRTGAKFETPGWEESLAKVGSIAVQGFTEAHKALGRIVEAPVEKAPENRRSGGLRP